MARRRWLSVVILILTLLAAVTPSSASVGRLVANQNIGTDIDSSNFHWYFLNGGVLPAGAPYKLKMQGGETRFIFARMHAYSPRTNQDDYLLLSQRVECHPADKDAAVMNPDKSIPESTNHVPFAFPHQATTQNIVPGSDLILRGRWIYTAPATGDYICRQWGLTFDTGYPDASNPANFSSAPIQVIAGTQAVPETYLSISDIAQVGVVTWAQQTTIAQGVSATILAKDWTADVRNKNAVVVTADIQGTACTDTSPSECSQGNGSSGTKFTSTLKIWQKNAAGAKCSAPMSTYSPTPNPSIITSKVHHAKILHQQTHTLRLTGANADCTRNMHAQLDVTVLNAAPYQSPLGVTGSSLGIAQNDFCASRSGWVQRHTNTDGPPENLLCFGSETYGDKGFVGDWDGNGTSTPGVWRQSGPLDLHWFLSNNTDGTVATDIGGWGSHGDIPVIGNWSLLDGKDRTGVFRPLTCQWFLQTDDDLGIEIQFVLPNPCTPNITPLAGDWDGIGHDGVGYVYSPQSGAPRWVLTNNLNGTLSSPAIDFFFGSRDDAKIAGDWNGDTVDTPGVVRTDPMTGFGRWFLQNGFATGSMIEFAFGGSSDTPIVGDFNGGLPHTDTPGRAMGDL